MFGTIYGIMWTGAPSYFRHQIAHLQAGTLLHASAYAAAEDGFSEREKDKKESGKCR